MAERQQQQQRQQPHCSSCKSHKVTGECRQEWAAPTLHATSTRTCMRHLIATLLARRKPTPAPRCDGGALGISRFTVASWPTLTCLCEVQGFLGLTNFYRRFVKNFAAIAKPQT